MPTTGPIWSRTCGSLKTAVKLSAVLGGPPPLRSLASAFLISRNASASSTFSLGAAIFQRRHRLHHERRHLMAVGEFGAPRIGRWRVSGQEQAVTDSA